MPGNDQYVKNFYFRYPDEDRIKSGESPFLLINSSITRPGGEEYDRENYPFTTVELVLEGSCQICIENEHFTVNAGDLYILPRLASHSITYQSEKHYCIKKYFVVSGVLMDHLLQVYGLYGIHHLQNIRTEEIEEIFDQMRRLYRTSGEKKDHNTAACLALKLIQLLSEKLNDTDSSSYTKQRILYWMKRHVNEKIDLKEMCYELGYSKSSLFRFCHKEFGLTPCNLQLQLRLDAAKKIMQDTPDVSLNDVAVRLGFCDSYHFSKVFKRYEGITPASFRKKLK